MVVLLLMSAVRLVVAFVAYFPLSKSGPNSANPIMICASVGFFEGSGHMMVTLYFPGAMPGSKPDISLKVQSSPTTPEGVTASEISEWNSTLAPIAGLPLTVTVPVAGSSELVLPQPKHEQINKAIVSRAGARTPAVSNNAHILSEFS